MATLDQLEEALVNADAAGDMDAARILAAAIIQARGSKANLIPGTQVPPTDQSEGPSIVDRAIGTAEAGATFVTGLTTGAAGMVGGTLKGLAEQILSGEFGTQDAVKMVEEEAVKGARALTRSPRTEQGQQQAAAIGDALHQILPVTPLTAELGMLSFGARQAAHLGRQVTGQVATQTAKATSAIRQRVLPKSPPPTAGTMGSAGAMGVDMATLRREKASELGFVGDKALTKGQATRGFDETRFERETAKLPEVGEPIRERFGNQQKHFSQVLDQFLDETGAETASLRGIGEAVGHALRDRAARDKVKIRTLYREAKKRGELEAPVVLSDVAAFLTSHSPEGTLAKVIPFAELKGRQLGVFADDGAGGIVAAPVTLEIAEIFRRNLNAGIDADLTPTNINFGGQLKRLVDDATEGLGGNLAKQARNARRRYGHDYENIPVIKHLLHDKRGTEERAIALEHVLNKVILEPSTSLDSMRQVRRLLHTEGENGKQAWRELQGGVIRHIKDKVLSSVTQDHQGNRIVSPTQLDRVITQLDRSGKLDYIFGNKGAEKLRVINDIAKDVLTTPPGAVNTSNTATVLAGLVDVAISGTAGAPVPVMLITRYIKNARLKAKVRHVLGE